MALREISITNYRSVHRLRLRLKSVNVLTGTNGCGKSNLYNSVFLLSKAATGGFAQVIAEEGGMESVLWAGPRRKMTKSEPLRMTISAITDHFAYELNCGLPTPCNSAFDRDPEVKEEYIWFGAVRRSNNTIFERSRAGTWARDGDGHRVCYSGELLRTESVLAQLRDPHLYPELSALRSELAEWRFYHHFRTDLHSPLRQPQVGVRTPVLHHDGRDLAAALQTIEEVGDRQAMREAIRGAFSGAELLIGNEQSRFSLALQMPNLLRPLTAQELSDGQLRYLCLVAALLSPRPPALLALNEPETSLHPDLLGPLARLIAEAARTSQLWITTHSRTLAEQVEKTAGERPVVLELRKGATQVVGQGLIFPDDHEEEG